MMKDDELWLKKIKERLDDYSEPLPDAGWERLEKALPTSAPMSVVGTKKKILFRRWAMTAVAVALVAVSSVSLWLLQSPVVDDVRRAAEPALAAIPDALPVNATPHGVDAWRQGLLAHREILRRLPQDILSTHYHDNEGHIRALLEESGLCPRGGTALAAAAVRGLILTVSHQNPIGQLYPPVLSLLVHGACRELF